MKIAVLLPRHRRLLVLCGLSAAAHLLVLELLARHDAALPAAPRVGVALRLRLTQAVEAPSMPSSAPADAPRAVPPAPAMRATAARHVAAPVPSSSPSPSSAPSPSPAAAIPEPAGTQLLQMPGRYRVRMPDPVRLSYALTRQSPGTPPSPAGTASIDWRSDGERYALTVEGVLGTLSSEGGSGDAGIAPRGAGVPDAVGAQDRASVLMQLAGIGLGEPDQIQGQLQGELRIVVGGSEGAEIARYQVTGQEDVATALGSIAAWRLAQVAAPGQDRLELWLAPARGWLPVQLRLTRPDGSAITQTLTRIEAGAPR